MDACLGNLLFLLTIADGGHFLQAAAPRLPTTQPRRDGHPPSIRIGKAVQSPGSRVPEIDGSSLECGDVFRKQADARHREQLTFYVRPHTHVTGQDHFQTAGKLCWRVIGSAGEDEAVENGDRVVHARQVKCNAAPAQCLRHHPP